MHNTEKRHQLLTPCQMNTACSYYLAQGTDGSVTVTTTVLMW